jgi:hypothetical protein
MTFWFQAFAFKWVNLCRYAWESKAAGVKDEKRAPRGGDDNRNAGGGWEWTLNWDPIVYDEAGAVADPTEKQLAEAQMLIGSCPRTAVGGCTSCIQLNP